MKLIMNWAIAPTVLAFVTFFLFHSSTQDVDDAAVIKGIQRFQPIVVEGHSMEDRIKSALSKEDDFIIVAKTLGEFFDFVRKQYDVNVLVNEQELRRVNVELNDRFSLSLKSAKLRSALKNVLMPRGLDFTVKHDALAIVPTEYASSSLSTVVYPSVDLVLLLQGKFVQSIDVDLIDLITRTIDPDSWEDNGGDGRIESHAPTFSLVVSQTEENHEKLRQLFASLRRTRVGAEEFTRRTFQLPLSEIHRLIDEKVMQDNHQNSLQTQERPAESGDTSRSTDLQRINAALSDAKRIKEQAAQIEQSVKQELLRRKNNE